MVKEMNLSFLNGKKIFIATPMYGGFATSQYIASMLELNQMCAKNNITLSYSFIMNESLVPRARNVLVNNFLKSEHDYLFFIDADIGFSKEDFLYMVHEAITKNLDIVCAAYPQKRIAWEMIEKAQQKNLIKNQNDYSKYSGAFGINFKKTKTKINTKELTEVMDCSTGFMLISKKTFISLKNAFPEQAYISDQHDNHEEMFAYFDTVIDKDTSRYLSEDYMFCKNAKSLGIKIWLAPWINLVHVGTNVFSGTYENFIKVLKNK